MILLLVAGNEPTTGLLGNAVVALLDAPAELAALRGTFHLGRGRVLKAARVMGRVYLNFGDDWRQDFTVTVDSRARRMFKKAGVDPLAFKGREVRVRGWLKKWNGPMIDATHPEQIEVLP